MKKLTAFTLLFFLLLIHVNGNIYSRCSNSQPGKKLVKNKPKQKVIPDDVSWKYEGFFIKI